MIKYKNKFSDPFGLVLEHIARNTQMMFLGQKKIWQNTEDKMFPIVCHTPCSLYPRVYVCTSVCLLLDVELRLCCSLVQLFRVIRYSNTELNEFRLAGHIQKKTLSQNVVPICVCFCSCISSVSQGFDAMKEQNICNKIMVKLIQNCRSIFESSSDGETCPEEHSTIIAVKVLSFLWTIYMNPRFWSVTRPLLSLDFLMSYPAVIDSSNDLSRKLQGLKEHCLFGY